MAKKKVLTPELNLEVAQRFHKNPRAFKSTQRRDSLAQSLKSLGDMGGIVINKGTLTGRENEFIGGNQRMNEFFVLRAEALGKAPTLADFDIVWSKVYETPTPVGTLAVGTIAHPETDEPFSVRLVDWDDTTCELANIKANYEGADFDLKILANEWDFDLLNSVFDDDFFNEMASFKDMETDLPTENEAVQPQANHLPTVTPEYTPIVNPSAVDQDLTEEDADKAREDYESQPPKRVIDSAMTVTCPHCGEDFQVNRA